MASVIQSSSFGGLRETNGYRIRSFIEKLTEKREPEFHFGCIGPNLKGTLPLYKYDPEDGSGIDKIRFKPSDIVIMREKIVVAPTAIT